MMQRKIPRLLTLALFLAACSETSSSGKAESPGTQDKSPAAKENSAAAAGIPALIGEWEQKFSSMDKNDDGELAEIEKVAAPYRMGFNYFEFRKNGECFRDSDLRLPGTFEVKQEGGHQQLYIHNANAMMSETYRYRIQSLTEDELILFYSGVFLIFNRK